MSSANYFTTQVSYKSTDHWEEEEEEFEHTK